MYLNKSLKKGQYNKHKNNMGKKLKKQNKTEKAFSFIGCSMSDNNTTTRRQQLQAYV